jgi:PilZ domain-containing protein
MAATPETPYKPRYTASLAVINLPAAPIELLQKCFRQYRIDANPATPTLEQLQTVQFDACAIRLDKDAETFLKALRSSGQNRRCLVYGFGSTQEAMHLSAYGINCLVDYPPDPDQTAQDVENTYLLLIGQLRRYVRLPLVTEVKVAVPGRATLTGLSREVSAGGLSVHAVDGLAVADTAQLNFGLPSLPSLEIPAVVCWRLDVQRTTGFQFRQCDDRVRLKAWIDEYLGLE